MKQMYGCIIVLILFILNFIFISCLDTTTNPNNEEYQPSWELEGSWVGTSFVFISQADTSQKADLSIYGVKYSMVVNADSSYSSSTTYFGSTQKETGKIVVDSNHITITSTTNESHSGTYEITERGVSLIIEDEEFDFNLDNITEPAYLYIDLEKVIY